jgi:tape measure domain-containing protein
VAGSSTEKLQDLAYAMSQVQMAGRLTGQENLQLINAGFSPLAVIAEQTGSSMGDLKKDMENGAISADMVKQALSDLTTGSGRLAGFQDKVAQSTAGMFAKAQTNLELLAIEIGGRCYRTRISSCSGRSVRCKAWMDLAWTFGRCCLQRASGSRARQTICRYRGCGRVIGGRHGQPVGGVV